jgi:hypothetical protein
MKKPSEVLSKAGLEAYNAHIFNIQEGLFFILSHEDDLELDKHVALLLCQTQGEIEKLKENKMT